MITHMLEKRRYCKSNSSYSRQPFDYYGSLTAFSLTTRHPNVPVASRLRWLKHCMAGQHRRITVLQLRLCHRRRRPAGTHVGVLLAGRVL